MLRFVFVISCCIFFSFDSNTVVEIARELSTRPYDTSEDQLPTKITSSDYDDYKNIRFNPASAIWKNDGLPFQLQLLHRGLYFQNEVNLAIVDKGQVVQIPYDRNFFTFDGASNDKMPDAKGYSGFRVHFPLNTPNYFDELIVFQGASYFRALGKGNGYGISARGLAINTAEPQGEEFPVFKAFWIEKPTKESIELVVYALMDSSSVTGAYRFSIRPGMHTITDVEAVLFPRVDLTKVALAPLTSMFMFSMNGRDQIDDYRPEVHDSDGLLISNGRNETLWRPLANPKELQISDFIDRDPQGFGLLQRARAFDDYQDLETHYEKRPSVWTEPLGSWGEGSVELIEIPSASEIHDNIISFWRPAAPIKKGTEFRYTYRLIWGDHPEPKSPSIIVKRTASGRADILGPTSIRLYVIDYEVIGDRPEKLPIPNVIASQGKVKNVVIRDNPFTHGYRLSFEFDPVDSKVAELRVELKADEENQGEIWLFRYTQ